ncbi:MAG: L-methionine (R)-S-oxide reductase [Parasphingorhabdus sp.]|jgi:L-methionine (R)-S-oxide reductase|uniref:GAF domain-containing protein n=1 Tax=Parasphingorhabdus sp. TaxID=2709688 RepID=UPI001B3EB104|nr:GAF domain-containing protein [Sphingomonadales bacterium]
MLEIAINSDQPADEFYADLISSASALVDGEVDAIANMANIAALIWQYVPGLNWAGFYRVVDGELVLGPFQGKTACIRIAIGAGVCGTAAATGEAQRVADVHAFPGHIACDADSRSELVIPVVHEGRIIAVLDLDSPLPDHFRPEDETGMVRLINAIARNLG